MKIPEQKKEIKITDSLMIELTASLLTLSLFAASLCAAVYLGEWGELFHRWLRILSGPGPLGTDYY